MTTYGTIGFIGLGNMASAIIRGLLAKGVVSAADIYGADVSEGAVHTAAQTYGIHAGTDNGTVAAAADILFLAVKPIYMEEAILQVRKALRPGTIVISIAAGKSLAFLADHFQREDIKLVRCMPNVAALCLEAATGVSPAENVTEAEKEKVLSLLSSFGTAQMVPERLMDAVVGVGGSSPAYAFLFMEALADGAVAAGMPRDQAYTFAAQSLLGSAKMVLEGGHPAVLKDMVCSPGGTTIQALQVLEEQGFRGAIMDAVAACVAASKGL